MPLPELGWLADSICREKHPQPLRTYVIDRNINYTNICISGCRFCAFFRPPGHPEGYVLTDEQILCKIEEAAALGATQILMQGGLHPDLRIDLLRAVVCADQGSVCSSASLPLRAGDRSYREHIRSQCARCALQAQRRRIGFAARGWGGDSRRQRANVGEPAQMHIGRVGRCDASRIGTWHARDRDYGLRNGRNVGRSYLPTSISSARFRTKHVSSPRSYPGRSSRATRLWAAMPRARTTTCALSPFRESTSTTSTTCRRPG